MGSGRVLSVTTYAPSARLDAFGASTEFREGFAPPKGRTGRAV